MGAPYIYDISRLRVNKNVILFLELLLHTSCDVYKEIYWIQQ